MANLGGANSGIPANDYGNNSKYAKDGSPVEEELGKRGRWLLSVSEENTRFIQYTREYREFLVACQKLELAHRHILDAQSDSSFLQYMATDDILLRIFEFLECQSLVTSTHTCSRFRELAGLSAARRVRHIAKERQLSNNMMLLRAKEQLEGIAIDAVCHVNVPTLLLSRRVRVSNSGDPEFNGIFYCTGSSGNGFVFSKPREPLQRVDRHSRRILSEDNSIVDLSRDENEAAEPGKLLRCIIEKRFSSEVRMSVCQLD
jgi:gluconate kinase